ncbi:MAG: hypothetical protein OEZ43_14265 [Gammaproteobacteria bacterium]|nr:hypothetical protein [Gammaproteobacteria bacterium]
MKNFVWVFVFIPLAFFFSSVQADEIPIRANVGFGLTQYNFHNAYDNKSALVYGSELSLQAVIDKDTLKKYERKVPAKFRKAAGKLDEVSVGHWAIPKSLFIHPNDGQKTAFGATWGIVPRLQVGLGFLKVGVGAGVIASYMYYHDELSQDTVHFIRPALRGGVNLSIPLFNRYLILEAGSQHDAYIPQTFFGSKSTWYVSSLYGMVHFRIPIKVKARI